MYIPCTRNTNGNQLEIWWFRWWRWELKVLKMTTSILEQYWIDQRKQRSTFPMIDGQFNQWTNRSDVFSSTSLHQIDTRFNSNNLSSSSTTNLTLKEFCPEKKEDDDDDQQSPSKRFVCYQSTGKTTEKLMHFCSFTMRISKSCRRLQIRWVFLYEKSFEWLTAYSNSTSVLF